MVFKSEDRCATLGLVGPDALKDTHAVVQGMGKDVGGSLAPGHKFTVLPNKAVAVRHGHGDFSVLRVSKRTILAEISG
jgi:hypothetical protein